MDKPTAKRTTMADQLAHALERVLAAKPDMSGDYERSEARSVLTNYRNMGGVDEYLTGEYQTALRGIFNKGRNHLGTTERVQSSKHLLAAALNAEVAEAKAKLEHLQVVTVLAKHAAWEKRCKVEELAAAAENALKDMQAPLGAEEWASTIRLRAALKAYAEENGQ